MRSERAFLRFACAALTLSLAPVLRAACPQTLVSPVSLPNGTTGTSYTQTVTGSSASATFSVTSGALPPGLGLTNPTASSIDVSGTPTQIGTFTFTLTATDANGCTGGRTYKMTVACGTITVNPANLPNGVTGTSYGQSVSASGGTPPYTYAVTAGSLPPGLALDTSSGAIQNAPTTAGSYSFTITATDGNACTGSQVYSNILVCDPPVITPTPSSLCPNVAGNSASGPAGAATYAWSITNGSIQGSTTSQTVSYTAGASGTTDLHLTTTSAAGCQSSATINVAINPAPATPTITPTPATICASSTGNGATTAAATTYAWSITNGSIQGSTTGQTISYTAGASGNTTLHLVVTNPQGCASPQADLMVPIAANPTLSPASGTLNALYHAGYNQVFTAASGTPPYTFTISPMTPPAGLTFTPAATTATLSGAAGTLPNTTTSGTNFTVTVTDANNCSVSQMYTLVVRPDAKPESYSNGVGNTQYVVAASDPGGTPHVFAMGNVLSNDIGPGALSAGPAMIASTNGGSVAMASNGTFTFSPPVGFTGPSDTFTYTLTDGNMVTNTAVVTVNLSGIVWYVDNTIGSSGDGRSHNPFKLLSDAQGPAAGKPQTGQTIYVHTGSGVTTGNLNLLASQQLIGNGVALSTGGLSLAAGTKPTISGAVALGHAVLVSGLAFAPTASAITSSGITGTSTVSQSTITATSSATTVSLATGGGTINFVNVPISKTGGTGAGVSISGKTGGAVSFDASSPVSVTAAGATGVSLSANTGGSVTFGTTLTLNTGGGDAFTSASGGTVTATDANNTITTTTGAGVNVTGSGNGGALTFKSINVGTAAAGPAKGIVLTNFTGPFVVTGTGTAGSGGTIQKTSGNGAEFNTVSNGAMNAVSLSWMNLTNDAQTQAITIGTNNTTPTCTDDMRAGDNTACVAGLYLRSVTGVGLDHVTVSGSKQMGINGYIVSNLSLTNSSVSGNGDQQFEHGINILQLTGTCLIQDTDVVNNAARQIDVLDRLSPATLTLDVKRMNAATMTIGNSVRSIVTGAQGIFVEPYDQATVTFRVDGISFPYNYGTAVDIAAQGSSSLSGYVQNSTVTFSGAGVNLQNNNSASVTSFDIQNNTFSGLSISAGNIGTANNATGAVTARVLNNTVGVAASTGSGCDPTFPSAPQTNCVAFTFNRFGPNNYRVTATGNQIHQTAGGIYVNANNNSTMNVKIAGNTIDTPYFSVSNPVAVPGNAFYLNIGTLTGFTTTACLEVTGNNIDKGIPGFGWDPNGSGAAVYVRSRNNSVFNLAPNYAGGTNTTNVQNFFIGSNTIATPDAGSRVLAQAQGGGTYGNGGAGCNVP